MGEKLNHSIKEKVKIKNSQMEQAEILGDHKKTKHMNHLYRRRRNLSKGTENHRRKIPKSKGRDAYQGARVLQNTKWTEPEKKLPGSYNGKNNTFIEQRTYSES